MVSAEHRQVPGEREPTSTEVPIVTVEALGVNCFCSSMVLNNSWAGSSGVSDEANIMTEDGVKRMHLKNSLPKRRH